MCPHGYHHNGYMFYIKELMLRDALFKQTYAQGN